MGKEVSLTLGPAWEAYCQPVAQEIAIHLCRGNWEAAHEVLDRVEARWKSGFDGEQRPSADPRLVALQEVLPIRLANTLEERFGALTAADLNQVPWEEIAETRHVGPAALKLILDAWRALGYEQRPEK